jgi:hypothetical protein
VCAKDLKHVVWCEVGEVAERWLTMRSHIPWSEVKVKVKSTLDSGSGDSFRHANIYHTVLSSRESGEEVDSSYQVEVKVNGDCLVTLTTSTSNCTTAMTVKPGT